MRIYPIGFKFAVAKYLLRQVAAAWSNADDIDQFKKNHIEHYGSKRSFDELVAEIDSIEFK